MNTNVKDNPVKQKQIKICTNNSCLYLSVSRSNCIPVSPNCIRVSTTTFEFFSTFKFYDMFDIISQTHVTQDQK